MANFSQWLSISRLRWSKFGRYVDLALQPLFIANEKEGLQKSSLEYDSRCLVLKFSAFGHDERLKQYLDDREYYDKGYFSLEELKFFFASYSPIWFVLASKSRSTVEDDRIELLQDCIIWESHMKYLLKAMDYWELRHDEKSEEWRLEYAHLLEQKRLLVLQKRIETGGFSESGDLSDEGYSTSSDVNEDADDENVHFSSFDSE